ncbi:prephenate dehydrogenase [Acholeplasma equirhinis]|uniref:prephenate dehydrogenase n=1 Tax=Acholeplasma equirhinis TaxID=555393 RepID=UPI00197AC14D|nr:prephenate dehydrogenase [Acholeplasma equirhinis]MBN3490834.1 prephenate dehydrogenase [Acholeplasma equirhinis]
MKIFIVGLGLMGASYAEKLTLLGHEVHGFDQDEQVNFQAKLDRVILSSNLNELKDAELVILALYPKENVHFVEKHKKLFNQQLITDIAGTKTHLVKELLSILPETIRYVSHHPMAGREKKGYFNRDISMFNKANFLVVTTEKSTKEDIKMIKDLGEQMGFGRITELTPEAHDKLIAHTSQLTHLLAVGLMLSDDEVYTKFATGDSFRDLTRIAKINEDMWTELFIDNKEALVKQTDKFIEVLQKLKRDIIESDAETLKKELRTSKEKRLAFDDLKS